MTKYTIVMKECTTNHVNESSYASDLSELYRILGQGL